jgi:phosphate:Na+ symporter
MIVQSSGATSGLVIAMGIAGTVNLAQAVPINLGASIGTCITAVLGSLALNREAKRTAYIHAVFQTIGVLIVYALLLIPFQGDRFWLVAVRWVTRVLFGSESLARQIAMAHTMMPILNHLFVFPALPLIVGLFNLVFPSKEPEHVFGPIHINDGLVGQPQIALEQSRKEIGRAAGIVEQMMQRSYEILIDTAGSAKSREAEIEQISLLDRKVDLLRNAIVAFLTKVARSPLSERHSRETVVALNTINELENLADVVDVNILDRARKLFFELSACLDEQAIEDVASVHGMVLEHFRQVISAFAAGNRSAAVELLTDRAPFRDLQAAIRDRHFQRLREGAEEFLQINPVYMDLLNHYNRINRHVLHIAKRMAENLEADGEGSAAGSKGGGSLSGPAGDSAGSAPPSG